MGSAGSLGVVPETRFLLGQGHETGCPSAAGLRIKGWPRVFRVVENIPAGMFAAPQQC